MVFTRGVFANHFLTSFKLSCISTPNSRASCTGTLNLYPPQVPCADIEWRSPLLTASEVSLYRTRAGPKGAGRSAESSREVPGSEVLGAGSRLV